MCVAKAFWHDPYLTELSVKVTSVLKGLVTTDRTIAYGFSGGQESDYGTIDGNSIITADKQGKQIVYTLAESHNLQVGDDVIMRIDWDRRYKIMRLHFAAELVLELINQNFSNPEKIGAHIGQDKARIDFVWQGNISQTFDLLEKELKRIIDSNVPIKSEFSDEENEVRYWSIENFAAVSCGGTHIKRTGEIGQLALKRNNIGKGKERIEITLRG